jgi:hypothetical protein
MDDLQQRMASLASRHRAVERQLRIWRCLSGFLMVLCLVMVPAGVAGGPAVRDGHFRDLIIEGHATFHGGAHVDGDVDAASITANRDVRGETVGPSLSALTRTITA